MKWLAKKFFYIMYKEEIIKVCNDCRAALPKVETDLEEISFLSEQVGMYKALKQLKLL